MFGPSFKKDPRVFKKRPHNNFYMFSDVPSEAEVCHMAGFLSPLLGWKVKNIEITYPDGIYRDLTNNENIRVEYKIFSRDFLVSGYDAKDCDVIFCWSDNMSQEEKEKIRLQNPHIKIIEAQRIFHAYDFELLHPSQERCPLCGALKKL